jgi:UDP-glucuronate 4-epimerase
MWHLTRSSSVYGDNESVPFHVKDLVDHPVSLYAATKKADELMNETCQSPAHRPSFLHRLRPWGRPDMAPWIFTSKILAGEPIPVFNHGKMRRAFTYIDDIVAGILAAVDHPPGDDGAIKAGGSKAPHALYNIGNNQSEELTRFIEVIEAACGRKAIIDYQPMQPGDVVETYADISAITRDLGYAPTTTIDVGLPNFVSWFRGYHAL